MMFEELPIGATFRFYRRGGVLTKTSASTWSSALKRAQECAPDVSVIPERIEPQEMPPEDPYGSTNTVEFSKKAVRLDGVFDREQLEAVLAALKKRR